MSNSAHRRIKDNDAVLTPFPREQLDAATGRVTGISEVTVLVFARLSRPSAAPLRATKASLERVSKVAVRIEA